jgi:hypothetical protein
MHTSLGGPGELFAATHGLGKAELLKGCLVHAVVLALGGTHLG